MAKKYRNIGIEWRPNASQKRSIDRHWKQYRREQSQRAAQSQIDDQPVQFQIMDHEQFEWTNELLDIAYQVLIDDVDIMSILPTRRTAKFEEVVNNKLALEYMAFVHLEPANLQKTFYNDFNNIRKLKNENRLNV